MVSHFNMATDHCIARANAKFNQLREVLCNSIINFRIRKKMLESCVISRRTYEPQKEAQLKKLEACWTQYLRIMVRGGWR